MKVLRGKALVDHMQQDHGYVTWNPPGPNTKEYKIWQRDHETTYHGRWRDQQLHEHKGK